MEKTKLDPKEILFIHENAPNGFAALVHQNLVQSGYSINRMQVHRELFTHKREYLKPVIEEARRLLKAIKQVEFSNQES